MPITSKEAMLRFNTQSNTVMTSILQIFMTFYVMKMI